MRDKYYLKTYLVESLRSSGFDCKLTSSIALHIINKLSWYLCFLYLDTSIITKESQEETINCTKLAAIYLLI